MTSKSKLDAIGYLSAIEMNGVGFVGGLLIVNQNARPLEFHCTSPFQPSQAQRVLYGGTLKKCLLAEQIPTALIQKTKRRPDIILVNEVLMLEVRDVFQKPVGCLTANLDESETENRCRSDAEDSISNTASVPISSEPDTLRIGSTLFVQHDSFSFAVHQSFDSDQQSIVRGLQQVAMHVDVDEPFERLKLALGETGKASSHAA